MRRFIATFRNDVVLMGMRNRGCGVELVKLVQQSR
jgi:hypothetical protein